MRRVPFDMVVRVRVDVPLGDFVSRKKDKEHVSYVVDFWHVYPDKNQRTDVNPSQTDHDS